MNVVCKVKGMERVENLSKTMKIEQSLLYLINACILHGDKVTDIKIEDTLEYLRITIKGEELKNPSIISKEENINTNKFLAALGYLCTECEVWTSTSTQENKQSMNLKNLNEGKVIYSINPLKFNTPLTSIIITIETAKFNDKISNELANQKKTGIVDTLSVAYRNMRSKGTKLILFGISYKPSKVDGNLVNVEDLKLNDITDLEIYRMNVEKRGLDVLINGVLIQDDRIRDIIKWGRKVFKSDGYTSTTLYLRVLMDREDVDLNDIDSICEKIETIKDDILSKIIKYREEFSKETVSINFEYPKDKMNKMYKCFNTDKANGVTRMLLDNFYERIK